jgi:deoxycytidine triphosphate deaminase
LVVDPKLDASGVPEAEAASYDLRAGIVVWRDKDSHEILTEYFDPPAPFQKVVTLKPGQMAFIITHELVCLPRDLCGTVYSRNRLQKENILALNAGHVDPGYSGPIIIRLINLGSGEWPLPLGEPIFTMVFHTVKASDLDNPSDSRSKNEMLHVAQHTAAHAFSNPLHDLFTGELDQHFAKYEQQLETRLREKFGAEFFRKSDITTFIVLTAVGILTLWGLIAKFPWDKLWNIVKSL